VLLEEAVKKTGKLDNATLISALHTGSWPSPEGNLSWDANGAPQSSYVLVQWVGGKLLPVFPTDRAQQGPSTSPLAWAQRG
jgi:branched-chain amino acid transport system substrate-binding protein